MTSKGIQNKPRKPATLLRGDIAPHVINKIYLFDKKTKTITWAEFQPKKNKQLNLDSICISIWFFINWKKKQYFKFTNRIPFLWHRNYIMVSGQLLHSLFNIKLVDCGWDVRYDQRYRCHSTPFSRPLCPSSCLAGHDLSCKTQGLASCQWDVQVGWTEQRKQRWQRYPRRPRGQSRVPPKTWNDPLWWCRTDTQPLQSPAWRGLEGTALHSCSLQWPGKREYGLNARYNISYYLFVCKGCNFTLII